ncbi:MAG TPA: GDP-L-fucose synthase [Candidatus Paceibacterota bacterium]|nr:GDP-L-fucose synthase [Candidatus Paceibacterota bacterium]HMO82747.1 GDP-L-fucose synthase [Candidatus Paceibacterota bacterium]
MEKTAKIYVAGHRGLVGSALVRTLEKSGFENIITRTRDELDLLNQKAVAYFFAQEKPEYVFLAAAKVGGIMANKTSPANFIYHNLQIQNNIIHNSYLNQVTKLLFLGSSCIYPKLCPQPIKEESLLTSLLETSNEAYALAKIAGLKMCQAYNKQYDTNFISVMPTNLYGPNDNFNLETAHVLPAFIRRFHEAKINNAPSVTTWGTGTPMREFLYVDDLATACLHLMETYDESEIVNIGTGEDVTIKELAETIANIVDYKGTLEWDKSKPDGTPRKLLDVSKIHDLGWHHSIELKEGIQKTYDWYLNKI